MTSLTVNFDEATTGTITAGGVYASVVGSPAYTSDSMHGAGAEVATDTNSAVRINNGGTATHGGSLYAKANAVGTGAARFVTFLTGALASLGSIRFHSDGHIDIANSAATRVVASTLSWSANTWLRVDWQFDSSTNTLTVRIFTTVEAASAAETISGAISAGTQAVWAIGAQGGVAGQTVTCDTFRATDGLVWLGPYIQPVSPTAISSAEAHGTVVLTTGPVTVSPSGIASAETFGTVVVQPGPVTVTVTGVASGEAFGSVTVSVTAAGPQTVSPTGIPSGEAFGTVVVTCPPWVLTTDGVEAYWQSPDPHRSAQGGRNRLPYRIPIAMSVLRIDGVWQAVTDPMQSQAEAADRYYAGGHIYVIPGDEALALIAAGFTANVEQREL